MNNNKMAEKLNVYLKNPKQWQLRLLDFLIRRYIPFNSPHKFRTLSMGQNQVQVLLPLRRSNLNHVRGIHACAIATAGELCAGLLIMHTLGVNSYRLIMSHLEITYLYQGKTSLLAKTQWEDQQKAELIQNLQQDKKATVVMTAVLTDQKQNVVAQVKSTWQLKDWSLVKTKV